MLNPFFTQGTRGEQNLVQDLINEQLRMYGVEVYYLPRSYLTTNTVIEEVIQSSFENAYPIEAYVQNYEGYDDNSTLLSKFGIQSTQEMTFIISKERFENYITPLTEGKANLRLTSRPKEGDIIYMPFGDRMFEIKFVEHEKPFYQLQKNYVYELRCELFRYEDEVIDTGVDEIDDTLVGSDTDGVGETGYSTILGGTLTMTLVGSATTATAITGIVDGAIRSITIGKQGAFYNVAPEITISSAPGGGITGIATATLDRDALSTISLTNAGAGYTVAPKVVFVSSTGIGATASTTIGDFGSVGIITVTSGGSGYTTSPTITFTGISTVSAAATAVVSAAGTITAINITEAGIGYTEAPTITISDPAATDVGDFTYNEVVTGSTSGTTARVRTWNTSTNVLELGNVSGKFIVGETIIGAASSATHTIFSLDNDPADDGYSENDTIELEADGILDFTEKNPFGIP
tara:strand:- start:1039 stop:2427 length:1389 start_codon:yes stop_codon:yes gene_type:complete